MGKIWTDENKFQKMLDIEILATEAFAQKGFVPKDALKTIKEKAAFSVKRINEIEAKTHHDVVAFIKNLSENIGDPMTVYTANRMALESKMNRQYESQIEEILSKVVGDGRVIAKVTIAMDFTQSVTTETSYDNENAIFKYNSNHQRKSQPSRNL